MRTQRRGLLLGTARRQYRSTAPVELVQFPESPSTGAAFGSDTGYPCWLGQVHAGKLKCGLGRGTFHPCWLSV